MHLSVATHRYCPVFSFQNFAIRVRFWLWFSYFTPTHYEQNYAPESLLSDCVFLRNTDTESWKNNALYFSGVVTLTTPDELTIGITNLRLSTETMVGLVCFIPFLFGWQFNYSFYYLKSVKRAAALPCDFQGLGCLPTSILAKTSIWTLLAKMS